jgi:hypothetical protein
VTLGPSWSGEGRTARLWSTRRWSAVDHAAVVPAVNAVMLGIATTCALLSIVRLATSPSRPAVGMFVVSLLPLAGAWTWFDTGRPVELRTRFDVLPSRHAF